MTMDAYSAWFVAVAAAIPNTITHNKKNIQLCANTRGSCDCRTIIINVCCKFVFLFILFQVSYDGGVFQRL